MEFFSIERIINISSFLITILVLVVMVFTLGLVLIVQTNILNFVSTSPFKYKIRNFGLTYFSGVFYVSFFIFFLYFLRAYNINKGLDLKPIYQYIVSSWDVMIDVFWLYKFLIAFIIFEIISITFMLIIQMYKYFFHQLFAIYLYFFYQFDFNTQRGIKILNIIDIIYAPRNIDIIAYMLYSLSYSLAKKMYKKDGEEFNTNIIPKYHPYKILYFLIYSKGYKRYNNFITFTPLIFIFYDCIFNDFVLTHVYYYMIIYFPLILYRNITIRLYFLSPYICRLLKQIYYEKGSQIYLLSSENKKILDIYIMNGLKHDLDLGLDIELYLEMFLPFEIEDPDNHIYRNAEGTQLHRFENGKFYEVKEFEGDKMRLGGEPWIELIDEHPSSILNSNRLSNITRISAMIIGCFSLFYICFIKHVIIEFPTLLSNNLINDIYVYLMYISLGIISIMLIYRYNSISYLIIILIIIFASYLFILNPLYPFEIHFNNFTIKQQLTIEEKIEHFYLWFEIIWAAHLSDPIIAENFNAISSIIESFRKAELHNFINKDTTSQELQKAASEAILFWCEYQIKHANILETLVHQTQEKLNLTPSSLYELLSFLGVLLLTIAWAEACIYFS